MPFELFDYLDARGQNDFKDWWQRLQKPERAKLRSRIDALQMYGEDIRPEMLADTRVPGILKLKVKGSVQLRPMLCKGPVNNNSEFTFLLGATERDFEFDPKDAPERADARKSTIAADNRRRVPHVPVTK